MSDGQKLKECISEYRKSNKKLDDNLKKAEEKVLQSRRERMEKQTRPY